MNWRYLVGDALNRCTQALLSSAWIPLNRYVPRGRHWMYDVQRARGTRRADVIFDVGANIGQTAWGLVRFFPRARIYCFEPVASTYERLRSNYGRHPQVQCVPLALGDAAERRQIDLCVDPERNTLVRSGPHDGALSGATEEIRIVTADEFCAQHGIRAIDILKMDVQGWELHVLRGCSIQPRFILAEVGLRGDAADMQAFAPLHEYLESRGYLLGGFYDSFRYGPRKEYVLFANALYILPQDSTA